MAYDKQIATREFTRWSDSYDHSVLQWLLFGPSHGVLVNRIRALAGDQPLQMLDVGCGTGTLAARVRTSLPHVEVWGVDLVSEMLAKGQPRWKAHRGHVFPVQGDSERLPFGAGTFDIVTCANSFHHYPRQDLAIAEMKRVLRPGGRLMLIDGYRDSMWGWFVYDVCVAGIEGEVHHASAQRFRELLTQAGFQAIAQRVFRGAAPFLITEALAAESVPVVPAPHLRLYQSNLDTRVGIRYPTSVPATTLASNDSSQESQKRRVLDS